MEKFRNIYKEIKHVVKYLPEPRGIIHVGGHQGQEAGYYKGVFESVLFIEPIPDCVKVLRKKKFAVIEAAITEKEGKIKFYITKDSDQYSSIFPGEYEIKEVIKVKAMPLRKIEPNDFQVLAIDAQGASMNVLRSSNLDYKIIIFEASEVPTYKGERPMHEIIHFLRGKGFELVQEYKHDKDVYDVLMIKN